MHSMQRQIGKLRNKGPGDNAKVTVLLNEYEDADKVLAQIVDNARLWRDSWATLLATQLQVVVEFESLYDPIVGATDGHGRDTNPTPQLQLERTFKLKEAYSDLKDELSEEVNAIEERVIKPAVDARDCIAPIRKTIKKRENKRLDYEKCQDKALKLQRKHGRSAKEEAALAKAQAEVQRSGDEFGIADDHLRETLPPIINASFSMVEPLLCALVMIQNRLLGLYYTTLHGYCEDFGFPSPPPPMEEVVATWNAAFKPIQSQVESMSFIARGKAIHTSMTLGNDGQPRKPTMAAPGNGLRRMPSGMLGNGNAQPEQKRVLRVPSHGSLQQNPSPTASEPSSAVVSRKPEWLAPTDFTTATVLGGHTVDRSIHDRSPGNSSYSSSSPNVQRGRNEYFGTSPTPSHGFGRTNSGAIGSGQITPLSTGGSGAIGSGSIRNGGGYGSASVSSMVIGKKKPPPPPPPKRVPSAKPEEWVVAQYAFQGQGHKDLSFNEGDRIKIVKKTDTDQDWWEGELNGHKGSFPANYCKAI